MSEELKPCPFCGGPAKHNDGGNSVYGRFWYAVWCEECLIEMSDRERWAEGAKLDPAYPPKECFTRWNARHDGAEPISDAQIDAAMDEYDRTVAHYRSHGGVRRNERRIVEATVRAALRGASQ